MLFTFKKNTCKNTLRFCGYTPFAPPGTDEKDEGEAEKKKKKQAEEEAKKSGAEKNRRAEEEARKTAEAEKKKKEAIQDAIQRRDPEYPSDMTGDMKSFIQGLLRKNPNERLNGAEALKEHKFFKNMLHTALPPLRPQKDDNDTSCANFDQEFLQKKLEQELPRPEDEALVPHFPNFLFGF